jgi:hypothetical protein
MENVGIFCSHLEYFTVIWYNVWSFGNIVSMWYIFHRLGILCHEKSGNPDVAQLNGADATFVLCLALWLSSRRFWQVNIALNSSDYLIVIKHRNL